MKRTVTITFIHSFCTDRKRYTYLTDDETIKVDDIVVVESAPGLGVGKVVDIDDECPTGMMRWVVQKVDMAAYTARRETEKKIKQITAALKRKKKVVDEMLVFKLMAEEDEGAKALFEELKKLTAEYGSM
jgi:hypothetical protein